MISIGAAIFCFFIAPMIVSGAIAAGSMIHSTVMYEDQKQMAQDQFNATMAAAEADREFAREQALIAQTQYNEQLALIEKQNEENNAALLKQFAENEIHVNNLEGTQAGRNLLKADIANRVLRQSVVHSYGKTNRKGGQ